MNEYITPKAGFIILICLAFLLVAFFCFATLFSAHGYSDAFLAAQLTESGIGTDGMEYLNMDSQDAVINADNDESSEEENISEGEKFTIIIDAGHGGEDPGAVVGDIEEKTLNLNIALKLAELFSLNDYEVILTRNDDYLLYNQGEEGSKKQYDLKNRVKIASEYENAVFISIHINKFYLESCKGAQIFYSCNNSESSVLAESIKNSVKLLQEDNKREIKNGSETIFILNRISLPAVLVECGFISNSEETVLLSDDRYRSRLAAVIYKGIIDWINVR